ncbi:hypothetical protein DPMN_140889 [Dreissena polymorpha]|uniref:Uncharacterized protein n=1 Tax=Dreissena polymorpha TaxID=45954 RepID=A0A9D4GBP7_DREPO|nr:hypothetical protein DPMN_140889 [Dreissena polymorpha]
MPVRHSTWEWAPLEITPEITYHSIARVKMRQHVTVQHTSTRMNADGEISTDFG